MNYFRIFINSIEFIIWKSIKMRIEQYTPNTYIFLIVILQVKIIKTNILCNGDF